MIPLPAPVVSVTAGVPVGAEKVMVVLSFRYRHVHFSAHLRQLMHCCYKGGLLLWVKHQIQLPAIASMTETDRN